MDYKIKIPFAEQNGKIVHISEVGSGLECNCKCCYCGSQLIARKGETNEHHFAHYNSEECEKSLETSIHKAAKQYLESSKKLVVPDLFYYDKNHLLSFEKVELEKIIYYENKYIKVDALGYLKDNHKIIIEFALTHFADERKELIFDKLKIPTIEVSLNIYLNSFDKIKETLLGNGFKEWLFYPIKDNPKLNSIINNYKREIENYRFKIRDLESYLEESKLIKNGGTVKDGFVGIGWGPKLIKPIKLSINEGDIDDIKVDVFRNYRLIIFNRKIEDDRNKSNLVVYVDKNHFDKKIL